MLFEVAKGMVRKVPYTKLVLMDLDLHPYLAALLVAALYMVGYATRVPQKGNNIEMTERSLRIS